MLKADGLVLDGIYAGQAAGTGIYLYGGRNNVKVIRSYTHNQTNSGFNAYAASRASTGIILEGNLVENTMPWRARLRDWVRGVSLPD